eukprot:jgi/Botrbrau1/14469/Bobra.0014s0107.1
MAAEVVKSFTFQVPSINSSPLGKRVWIMPPPTCLAHSGTPFSKFERTNNEKNLLHTHMHTVSAS